MLREFVRLLRLQTRRLRRQVNPVGRKFHLAYVLWFTGATHRKGRTAKTGGESSAAFYPPHIYLGLLTLCGSLVPFFPVYGFTLPFVDQLSSFERFGVVRTCGGTYVPSFLKCLLTLVESAKLQNASAIRRNTLRIPHQNPNHIPMLCLAQLLKAL